jgi:RNA polymerase sigma factor (sigma-70 family)
MDEKTFLAALAEELPLVQTALRGRFPDTPIRSDEIAKAARHNGKQFWNADMTLPVEREGLFAWLFGVAFRRHVLNLVAGVIDEVRNGLVPVCRRLGVSPEDVVQEAWVRAQRSIEGKGEGSLEAYGRDDAQRWFWRVAFNVAHDQRRRLNRRQADKLTQDPPAPDRGRNCEELDRLYICVSRLPDGERRVIALFLQGRKPARIAEELAEPTKHVYYLIRRAKLLLGLCLGEEPVEIAT